jgi:membrane carboxypeptidase/penicillin-binding protein
MERAKEFMRKLRVFLGEDNHLELGTRELGNTIDFPCFNEHMMDANSIMTEP